MNIRLLLLLIISTASFAQKRTISGLILDENKMAIPYANITIKNTKRGTQADSLGRFEILVLNDKERLILSIIGFEKKKFHSIKIKNFILFNSKQKLTDWMKS